MSCQRESEGSSDGTSKWESCEGGTGEELAGSVSTSWDLVSCVSSDNVLI